MARDGVRGKKSTDLVVYVINEATKLLKGTSVNSWEAVKLFCKGSIQKIWVLIPRSKMWIFTRRGLKFPPSSPQR